MDRRPEHSKRTVRMMVVAAAFLLLGASTPTRCSPPRSPRTLTGAATRSSRAEASGPACPTFDGPFGPVAGAREVWTARIAGKDPKEWLRIEPCLENYGSHTSSDGIGSGPFVIYTQWGEVRGNVTGYVDADLRAATGYRPWAHMELALAKGTGAYRGVTKGSLWYSSCLALDDSIIAAAVTTAEPTGPPAACLKRPDLAPLYGSISSGHRGAATDDATCPAVTSGSATTRRRETWTARVAASDPTEWLHIDACIGETLPGPYLPMFQGGTFTIYTTKGVVSGEVASGGVAPSITGDEFFIYLAPTSGTGRYLGADAVMTSLTVRGCEKDGTIVNATLNAETPDLGIDRCPETLRIGP